MSINGEAVTGVQHILKPVDGIQTIPVRDQVSEYARDAMRWAVGNGLLVGMSDGRLCPRCHTNRAEFATVIQRFCETIAR